jgi:hypothetical protein
MKYAIEMGSGTMKYIPSSIKFRSATHKLTKISRRYAESTSLFSFLKIRKSRPKMQL